MPADLAAIDRAMGNAATCRKYPTYTHPLAQIPREWLLLGDPQDPLQRLMQHLAHEEAIGEDGWLKPSIINVGLSEIDPG